MDLDDAFRSYHEALFRFLARACGDAQLAQDAVQETFLRLHLQGEDRVSAVRSWLFTTGLNVVRDTMRTSANRARILEKRAGAVPGPSSEPGPDERLESLEDRARLRRALERLRERERTALLMREEGFKHREIAEALETTTGSVGTLIARALVKLEDALEASGGVS